MDYECIKVEEKYDGAVTRILLDQPPGNIVSVKMMDEILDCLGKQNENKDKKLIIFAGQGDHFSYGASVKEHLPEEVGIMLPKFHNFILEIIESKIPTLAQVSGLCLGGGFELVLATTFIFAEDNSKFGLPEIKLGVFPPPACILLPLKGGDNLSTQMILSGETFDAETLYRNGVISKTYEKGCFREAVDTFIEKVILPKSASSLRIANTGCRMMTLHYYKQNIERLEDLYLNDLMATKDAAIGIKSFLEKTKPKWVNE